MYGNEIWDKTLTLAAALGLVLWGMPAATFAQSAPVQPISAYIQDGWSTLGRSMSECKSVVDSKVTTEPTLYLPAGMPTPPAVAKMQSECKVHVAHLPRRIYKMGDVKVTEVPKEGLLYLPNRYVVPGGRFNEMYGWDSYFIILGLLEDKKIDLAKGMVENFFFEIENYGALLNANRTYFFTRSQPPFLAAMIRDVYAQTGDKQWLQHAYKLAKRDYDTWVTAPHLAGNSGLARYSDLGEGPVPEMADDSSYYPDVIRWLLAHPDSGRSYLVDGSANPDSEETDRLAKTSCDVRLLKVCAAAVVNGHRLSAAYYRGDRAMRESGFDTSFRFGPFSGSTEEFAPVCLNSLLYAYELNMRDFATILGKAAEAGQWSKRAARRKSAMMRLLWHADAGMFYDYNFVTGKPSAYKYIATFYPLWAGVVTKDQAAAVEKHLADFEKDGGLAMSDRASGTQWDLPFGWAPTNWIAVKGLGRYGYTEDAKRISQKFTHTVEENYNRDGTIREKYNVVSGSANVLVAAGYKANVVGFGWTNGVYLKMKKLLEH